MHEHKEGRGILVSRTDPRRKWRVKFALDFYTKIPAENREMPPVFPSDSLIAVVALDVEEIPDGAYYLYVTEPKEEREIITVLAAGGKWRISGSSQGAA